MAGVKQKKGGPAGKAAAEPAKPQQDGPVLTVIAKRLRAFRKKLNQIKEVEDKVGEGKEINDDQREKLASKQAILSAIDELEKLGSLLGDAVQDEAAVHRQHGREEAEAEFKAAEAEKRAEEAMKEAARDAAQAVDAVEKEEEQKEAEQHAAAHPPALDTKAIEKFVQIMYFSQVRTLALLVCCLLGCMQAAAKCLPL